KYFSYQTTYERNGYSLKHATIKGAGHVVALTKPEEALSMILPPLPFSSAATFANIMCRQSLPPSLSSLSAKLMIMALVD
nr:putative peptidase S10, serine carboxypeptidase, alpha/beta hydrolase fold protein [Tanacetum cinerariifolium]